MHIASLSGLIKIDSAYAPIPKMQKKSQSFGLCAHEHAFAIFILASDQANDSTFFPQKK